MRGAEVVYNSGRMLGSTTGYAEINPCFLVAID